MNEFNLEEIPVNVLEQFGISKEMIEDLPAPVVAELVSGHRTPVLPITVMDKENQPIYSRARIALMRDEHGVPQVLFYPQLEKSDLSMFSKENQERLYLGKPVIDFMTTDNGHKVKAFHQIDIFTGQVLSVPTQVIGHNLQMVADGLHLKNAELRCLQEGEPLTLVKDEGMVTIGIDLDSNLGIRLVEGDERKWREQPRNMYSKYNFGMNGCWVVGDDGGMNYVEESGYTDEMWNELAKVAQRRAMSMHK